MKPEFTVTEIQLVYTPSTKPSERPKISTSKCSVDLFMKIWDKKTIDLIETFKVMFLSRSNSVLGIVDISRGGISGTVVDPKIIFGVAVKAAASAMILAHNHPSGNLRPSQPDIVLTQKIKEGAKLFDIVFLDHLIISSEGYLSMAEEGLI